MGRLWSTIALVVVLAGLGAYIYFVDSERPASTGVEGEAAREKFFTVEADKINEIRLTYNGQSALLRKDENGWKMIEPTAVEADFSEVVGLTQGIASIESVREVVQNPADLAQFGLAEAPIQVEFKAEGGVAGAFKLGGKNPQQSEIYAMKGGDNRVVLVSSFQETSFTKEPFTLRDKRILKFDREKADTLAMVRANERIEMARTGSEWKILKPGEARTDYSAVEGLLTRLSSANMSKLVEEQATDLPKYGLDKPEMTITIGAESAQTVLQIGKTENDQTYAKDASRPMVFTIDSTMQTDARKPFDDYRKKELFELRPFYLSRLRAVLDAPAGPKTYEFEKMPPAREGEAETWKVTRVGGASHTADPTAMDDLLNKLVAIKAESFVTGNTPTGLARPALVVSASFDEGKFERVRFGAVDNNAYASRDGEAGVAKIDQASMRAAMQAFDVVVVPPDPPPSQPEAKQPEAKK